MEGQFDEIWVRSEEGMWQVIRMCAQRLKRPSEGQTRRGAGPLKPGSFSEVEKA